MPVNVEKPRTSTKQPARHLKRYFSAKIALK